MLAFICLTEFAVSSSLLSDFTYVRLSLSWVAVLYLHLCDKYCTLFRYIVYPGEAGSESLAFNQNKHERWRMERPPTRRLGHIEPAMAFGLTNNYGNDPYKGYSLVHKHQVSSVQVYIVCVGVIVPRNWRA